MKKLICVMMLLALTSCDNYMARSFGGDMTINLKCNHVLVTSTWKRADLWYLTRPAVSTDKPKTSTFTESSMYGVAEGSVTFVEKRCN